MKKQITTILIAAAALMSGVAFAHDSDHDGHHREHASTRQHTYRNGNRFERREHRRYAQHRNYRRFVRRRHEQRYNGRHFERHDHDRYAQDRYHRDRDDYRVPWRLPR